MQQLRNLRKFFLFLVAAVIAFSVGAASAAEKPRQGADILQDTYRSNIVKLETNSFGVPLIVESSEQDDRVHVDVYGIFEHPFSSIAKVLKAPSNWCDIVSLHPNIKACTHKEVPGVGMLTYYLGRKEYQTPEDSNQIICRFQNIEQQNGYMDILLNAEEGPFGTKDHRMRFEALPIDGGRTFVHVSYAYSDSVALRLMARIYFATLGRSKAGFTVTGTDGNGNPVYIGGPRGAVERSAVRCYFAIQSFMNTLRYPEENRFRMRISEWYDLTLRYRKQLFDMDKQEYLTSKTTERKNQAALQQRIERGLQ